MKNEELYRKSVDILVAAYFNDTLAHEDCCACAIGNLIAANNQLNVRPLSWSRKEDGEIVSPHWSSVHMINGLGENSPNRCYDRKEGERQLRSTGYTTDQTAKIEWAFERAPKGNSDDEWMFNGLMAVIDVLDEIHENKNEFITTATKKRFEKVAL